MSEGTILVIGGAEERSSEGRILRRFVDLCGRRRARIAVIPTASQLEETGPNYEQIFTEIGAREVHVLAFEDRSDCERPEAIEFLEGCDGVFFTGGNQLRLSTILGGTHAAELIRHRQKEGLIVAGTSAGAAILSEHMIAYGGEGLLPRAGLAALSPGLGLLRTVIVDQHFSQRHRLGRLVSAVAYNPRLLGLGVDEDTAAILHPEREIEVIGSGTVTLVDASEVEQSSADRAGPGDPIALVGLRLSILIPGMSIELRRSKRPALVSAR